LKCGFQGGESCGAGTAKNIVVTIEVASTQHAGELVFTCETRFEIELKVVVEGGGSEAFVALLSQSIGRASKLIRPHHEVGDTLELGGGGELGCFQFANASFEAVNASAEDGEFGFEFFREGDAVRR
jgi:hypothetical protein